MKALVHVKLKAGVLDPQGKAIGNALAGLEFTGIGEVRQGKLIELELAETDAAVIVTRFLGVVDDAADPARQERADAANDAPTLLNDIQAMSAAAAVAIAAK